MGMEEDKYKKQYGDDVFFCIGDGGPCTGDIIPTLDPAVVEVWFSEKNEWIPFTKDEMESTWRTIKDYKDWPKPKTTP